jgi:hypothetical protein
MSASKQVRSTVEAVAPPTARLWTGAVFPEKATVGAS